MKLSRIAVIVILLPFLVIAWYQWSYPFKWERIIYPLEYREAIATASAKYDIDPYLISAIIYEESKFSPSSESKVGAIGLMQIMPETGRWIANKQGRSFTVDNLYGPNANVDMGCWYFRFLRDKYANDKLALAAYNSGDKNVDRWLADDKHSTVDEVIEKIPFEETRTYVLRVLKTRKVYERIYPGEFKEDTSPDVAAK